MSGGVPTLRVLLLPVPSVTRPWDLMLPAAAAAEVVRAAALEAPLPGAPDWLCGFLTWRGLRLPVVRLTAKDASIGPSGERALRIQAVVCRAPSGDPALPFFAIESPGVPHLQPVTPQTLGPETEIAETEIAGPAGRPFIQVALRLLDRPAGLVDLDAVECAILAALPTLSSR